MPIGCAAPLVIMRWQSPHPHSTLYAPAGEWRKKQCNSCVQEWNGIPGQWWFGGGTDITPAYLNEEDMRHFHGTYKVIKHNLHMYLQLCFHNILVCVC